MDRCYWSWTFLDARILHEHLQIELSMGYEGWKEVLRAGTCEWGPINWRQQSTPRESKHMSFIAKPPYTPPPDCAAR